MLFGFAVLVVAAAPSTLWTELRDTEVVFVGRVDTSAPEVDHIVTQQVLKGQPAATSDRPRDHSGPGFLNGSLYVFFERTNKQVAGQRLPSSAYESRFHYGPFSAEALREVVTVMTQALALQRQHRGREPDEWLLQLLATKALASTAARSWKSLDREPPREARELAAQHLLAPSAEELSGPALASLLWLAGPTEQARVDERVLALLERVLEARPSAGFYYRAAFSPLRERIAAEDTLRSRGLLTRLDALIEKVGH